MSTSSSAADTRFPIIRCFKDGKLEYELWTTDAGKLESKGDGVDFDWVEITEPCLNPNRVLFSCTPHPTKNIVKHTKSSDPKVGLKVELTMRLRNMSMQPGDVSSFPVKISAHETAYAQGRLKSLKLDSFSINGNALNILKPNGSRHIWDVGGLAVKSRARFDFNASVSIQTILKLSIENPGSLLMASSMHAFILVGQKTYMLQSETTANPSLPKTVFRLTINPAGEATTFKLTSAKMKFGQKPKFQSRSQQGTQEMFSEPHLWTLWAVGYDSSEILNAWNSFADEHHFATGSDISLVPTLKATDNESGIWAMPTQINDLAAGLDIEKVARREDDPFMGALPQHFAFKNGPLQPVTPASVIATFNRFCGHSGNPLIVEAKLLSANINNTNSKSKNKAKEAEKQDATDLKLNPENLIVDTSSISGKVWISNSKSKLSKDSVYRLGAFEMRPALNTAPYDGDQPYDFGVFSAEPYMINKALLSFEVNLPLEQINLVGQDTEINEDLEASVSGRGIEESKSHKIFNSLSVLVPTSSSSIANTAYASFSENNFLASKPRTAIRIKKPNDNKPNSETVAQDEPKSLSAIVVDNSPLTVVQIKSDSIFVPSEGEVDLNEIAIWTNFDPDGRGWKILSKSHQIDLNLPPQCIGEAFERKDSFPAKLPVPYRFSPSATLTVKSADARHMFSQSPWNLRRLLGYPSDEFPGCKLTNLEFELLYGLDCKVNSSNLRLTEIFNRYGWTADYKAMSTWTDLLSNQKASYASKVRKWNSVKRSFQSRLCIYSPYIAGSNEVTISSGIQFQIRNTAKLEYPIDNRIVPEGDQRRRQLPFVENGLAGGVTRGFESPNILDQVMLDSSSTSGMISEPQFSALGGSGYQKAVFLDGITKIYSNTTIGRTDFYSVERLGRICIIGHLAKHVVVYERSVAPSKQFVTKNTKLIGIPVVRKVREYIEILEPSKPFPDTTHSSKHSGFTKAIEFATTIIPVDSDWGRDVPTGWEVPLWNELAHLERPEVYPKPLVANNSKLRNPHKQQDPPAEFIPFDKPHHLFFYTCTTANASPIPKQWPLVAGADFPFGAPPRQNSNLPAYNSTNYDGELPPTGRVIPGLERFSLDLVKANIQPNICAASSDEGLSTYVRNITLVRDSGLRNLDNDLNIELTHLREIVEQCVHVLTEAGNQNLADHFKPYIALFSKYKPFVSKAQIAADKLKTGFVNKIKGEVSALSQLISRVVNTNTSAVSETITVLKNLPFDQIQKDEELLKSILSSHLLFFNSILRPRPYLFEFPKPVISEITTLQNFIYRQLSEGRAILDLIREEIAAADNHLEKALAITDYYIDVITNSCIPLRKALSVFKLPFIKPFIEATQDALTNVQKELIDTKELLAQCTDCETLLSKLKHLELRCFQLMKPALKQIKGQLAVIRTGIAEFSKKVKTVETFLTNPTDYLIEAISLRAKQCTSSQELQDEITKLFDDLNKTLTLALDSFSLDETTIWSKEPFVSIASEWLPKDSLKPSLDLLIAKITAETPDIQEIETTAKEFLKQLDTASHAVAEKLKEEYKHVPLANLENSVMNLQSAVCERLETPPLRFNRASFDAFFFTPEQILNAEAIITPCVALVSKAQEELQNLNTVGMRVFTQKLLDRPIPDLKDLLPKDADLQVILQEVAGLKKLLPNFPITEDLRDLINFKELSDELSGKKTLNMLVEIPIKGADLFNESPIRIKLNGGVLHASSATTIDIAGHLEQHSESYIKGDWLISVCDEDLIQFGDTTLTMDSSGEIHFDLGPSKVELKGILASISDLMSSIPGLDKVNKFTKAIESLDKPIVYNSTFDMKILEVSAGCFTIKGLNIHAGLGLSLLLKDLDAFTITTELFLARKGNPFALTVFCLGGGGWFEFSSKYLPFKSYTETRVSVGIAAMANFELSLGPISGGVTMSLGIGCEFTMRTGSATAFAIVVVFSIRGEVDLCGIVSASIALTLSMTYERLNGHNTLVARGRLEIEIEICWCFTLSIDEDVEYTLVGGSSEGSKSFTSPAAYLMSTTGPKKASSMNTRDEKISDYIKSFA